MKLLMATTAAVVLGAASPGFAQSAGNGGWVSVEGGLAAIETGYGSYTYPVVSTGTYDTAIPGTGINMAFEVGVNILNTPYSISLGFRNSSVGSTHSSYYYDYEYEEGYESYGSDEASFTTLDFEVGRSIALGGAGEGRITLGIRGAAIDTSSSYYGYHSSSESSSNFVGAGPRVALEASVPVHNNISLDLEVGAAMLFGTTTDAYEEYHGSRSSTTSTTVTDIDFSAALSYLIGESSKVSLGYRVEKFSGLQGGGYGYEPRGPRRGGPDVMIDQGAFLKFTTGF